MKNFIVGVHRKIQFLRGLSRKTNIKGGLPIKGSLDSLQI